MSHEVWCDYCGEDERKFSGFCCKEAERVYTNDKNKLWAFSQAVLSILKKNKYELDLVARTLYNDASRNKERHFLPQYWENILSKIGCDV
ncbi:MAG: hypothetical protein WC523_03840 [Patescibacteria group bacterium]